MTNVQERLVGNVQPAYETVVGHAPPFQGNGVGWSGMRNDSIRSIYPLPPAGSNTGYAPVDISGPIGGDPYSAGFGSNGGGLSGMIQSLMNMVQQLLSSLGMDGATGGLGNTGAGFDGLNGTTTSDPQTGFQNVSASSTGDPHLAINGTTSNGSTQSSRYDSMVGHDDLLDSDSFNGGYQVSTSATQPNANGITYNQQASVTTNYGQTQVTLDNNGNATIDQNGQLTSLADGQSIDLGNGESVTRSANGSVLINEQNGNGGTLTTTLSENGNGVDVNAQGSNVDLGGDLVNQAPASLGPPTATTGQGGIPQHLRHHHHRHPAETTVFQQADAIV